MPVIVALAIRSLIQMAVTLGIVSLAEKYVLPLINKAIQEIIELFGVSEEDAQDIMANEIIVFAESVGIGALTLRTKLPTKITERLGFSAKGYTKRTLSPKAKAKVEGTGTTKTTSKVATAAEVTKTAEVIAKSRGISAGVVGSLLNKITGYLGTTALWYLALINTIDFANWEGAYQSTFQKIFTNFGLNPDSAMPKANTLSSDIWKRIYSTIEELEPLGVSFPVSGIDKPYNRQNLASLIDEITATMVLNGENPTYKKVIGMALPFIQLSGRIKNVSSIAVAPADASSKATSIPTTKVFTGIVSQGVVQAGLTFEARQDDLIESVDELKSAAANNLAPFLQSLPGKVIYEVKVVSSITTKDGFKQTGQAQRIQTGTTKAGVPTYKTVINKFATLILYIMTDKGTRTKITTIVLGPVNSAKLSVQQNDLTALALSLPGIVTTTNIAEIQGIVTNTPVSVTTPTGETPTIQERKRLGATQYYMTNIEGNKQYTTLPWGGNDPWGYTNLTKANWIQGIKDKITEIQNWLNTWDTSVRYAIVPKDKTNWNGAYYAGPTYTQESITTYQKLMNDALSNTGIYDPNYVDKSFSNFQAYAPTPSEKWYTKSFYDTLPDKEKARLLAMRNPYTFEFDTAPAVSQSATTPQGASSVIKTPATATTLFEWYQSQGQNLPSVQTRSQLYERLGLGQASYYTGTTEQNTKLLNALKGGANATPLSTQNDTSHIVDNMYLQV